MKLVMFPSNLALEALRELHNISLSEEVVKRTGKLISNRFIGANSSKGLSVS